LRRGRYAGCLADHSHGIKAIFCSAQKRCRRLRGFTLSRIPPSPVRTDSSHWNLIHQPVRQSSPLPQSSETKQRNRLALKRSGHLHCQTVAEDHIKIERSCITEELHPVSMGLITVTIHESRGGLLDKKYVRYVKINNELHLMPLSIVNHLYVASCALHGPQSTGAGNPK